MDGAGERVSAVTVNAELRAGVRIAGAKAFALGLGHVVVLENRAGESAGDTIVEVATLVGPGSVQVAIVNADVSRPAALGRAVPWARCGAHAVRNFGSTDNAIGAPALVAALRAAIDEAGLLAG